MYDYIYFLRYEYFNKYSYTGGLAETDTKCKFIYEG
jgi:hypothetical protein